MLYSWLVIWPLEPARPELALTPSLESHLVVTFYMGGSYSKGDQNIY
jgi:hypothetical protein